MSTQELTERQQRNALLMTRFINYATDAGLDRLADQAGEFVHPEIEWTPGLVKDEQATYRGMDEYLAYLRRHAQGPGGRSYLNVREVRPIGEDRVLVLAYVHYEPDEGSAFDSDWAMLARIEGGLIRKLRSFVSNAEAERAAGV